MVASSRAEGDDAINSEAESVTTVVECEQDTPIYFDMSRSSSLVPPCVTSDCDYVTMDAASQVLADYINTKVAAGADVTTHDDSERSDVTATGDTIYSSIVKGVTFTQSLKVVGSVSHEIR